MNRKDHKLLAFAVIATMMFSGLLFIGSIIDNNADNIVSDDDNDDYAILGANINFMSKPPIAFIGESWTYTPQTDVILPTLTYTKLPHWVTNTGGKLSGTPTGAGLYDIDVTASHPSFTTTSQTQYVLVMERPRVIITSTPQESVIAGQTWTYKVTTNYAPEPQTTTITASGLPSWLSFDGTTFTGQAPIPVGTSQTFNIKVEAKRNGWMGSLEYGSYADYTPVIQDIKITVYKPQITIDGEPNTNITAGQTDWTYKPTTTPDGVKIKITSGPSWLSVSSDGTTLYTNMAIPTPVGGPYNVTITASKVGCIDAVKTFTLKELDLSQPSVASVKVTPQYGKIGSEFTIDGSESNYFSKITLTTSDGRSTNNKSMKLTYTVSGKYTATATVTGNGTDTAKFDFLVYDPAYIETAFPTKMYRYTPNIPLNVEITSFRLIDRVSNESSKMVWWDDEQRCVRGTPGPGNVGHTYDAELRYGAITLTWKITVLEGEITFTPYANIKAIGKGLTIEIDFTDTNTTEKTSQATWTIKDTESSWNKEAYGHKPAPISVPKAGMYKVTLKLVTPGAPSDYEVIIISVDVQVKGNTTPPVDPDGKNATNIICFVPLIIGMLVLAVSAVNRNPYLMGFGMLIFVIGIALFFMDTSGIDNWIYSTFKGE